MSQPDFSEYVNNICKGIKSRPMREDIMEELTNHLEDNYERNLAVGMTEEEAKQNAIDKMGDSEALSYRLSAVHSYSPLKAMGSAFTELISGYAFFNFFISGSFRNILFFLGVTAIFSSLLKMRKMNPGIEKAFHFFNFSVIAMLALYCLNLGRILPFEITAAASVVIYLLLGIFWFLLFTGLDKFCQPYLTEDKKRPHLRLCGVYQMLLSFFSGLLIALSDGEDVNFAYIIPFIIIFMYVYGIIQLVRMRKILWDADGEYGILQNSKKLYATYIGVLVLCTATVLVFNYASATESPVKTELVIHDVSEAEQAEADKVRQKLLDWDVKQQIVEDLPDSEILQYKDAAFVTWGADGGSMWNGSSGVDSTVWYYCFFLYDKNSNSSYDVRLLCYIESDYSDKIKSFYRRGFYYAPWDNILSLNTGEGLNDSFISIVTDEKGKKYNAEPFYTYNLGDDYALEWPKGFEYKEEKGQRVYYAANISIQTFAENVTIHTDTLRKRSFLNFKYYTTADFAETILDYGNVISRGEGLFPYSWKEHPLFIWNADNMENEENIKKLIGKSKEMK